MSVRSDVRRTALPSLDDQVRPTTRASGRSRWIEVGVGVLLIAGGVVSLARSHTPATTPLPRHRNGAIAVLTVSEPGLLGGDLYLVNADGTDLHRLTHTGDGTVDAAFSPDGTRLAFANAFGEGDWSVSLMNADGTGRHQITPEGSDAGRRTTWEAPSWLPNGTGIRFYAQDGGGPDQGLWRAHADGTGMHLVIPGWHPFLASWSPDGSLVAWEGDRGTGTGGADLFVGDPTGVSRRRLTSDPGQVGLISWSPDGRRLVFENSGEIDVITVDGTGRRTLFRCGATCRGAAFPVWSPDGRQIAFTVVDVEPDAKPMGTVSRVDVMNADGTGVHPIGTIPFGAIPVAWQPLPG